MRATILLFIFILLGCTEDYEVPNHAPGVVKVVDGYLMVAYGEGGLIISNEASGSVIAQIFPPQGMNSIDDFDVDGNLIFLLDSRGRDYLAIFTFDGISVSLESDPVPVQGGPFNGISASNGNLVVAGGTTFLSRYTYSSSGKLEGPVTFGRDRGHPDVLLSSDGQAAFVSTDFVGGESGFGVSSLFIGDELKIPFIASELIIPEAGFTTGVTSPVGFPIQTSTYNDHLLVAHGGGLTIISLTEDYYFGNSQDLNIGINANSIAVHSDTAYIIGYQGDTPALVRVDLTDISNPTVISTEVLNTNGSIPTSISLSSSDIYIAAGASGIIVLPIN